MQEQATNTAAEETELSRTPLAFMSYVNDDDKYANGKITKFREHLSRTVKAHRGEPLDIFQDRDSIKWGQQWQERINESLDAVTFLIPIITPSFFNSTPCRDELERFLKREEELGRKDLILPVYYIECPVLNDKAKQEHDKLAQIIAARQYADWRELCHYSFATRKIRKSLAEMAQQIVEALERSKTESVCAEAVRKADTAKETLPPEPPKKDGKEAASSSNTFHSGGRQQSAALGNSSIGTYSYIMGLMEKFELCYPVGEEAVLIPQLLPVSEPPFDFKQDGSLRFALHYPDFLPPSVFSRFMVKVYRDIKAETCWRTGVLLEDKRNGAQALVKADIEARRINIWVNGEHRREYLHYLRYTLADINSDFEKLTVSERVPMPDNPHITADYQTLLDCVRNGIERYMPDGAKRAYSVKELLGLVQLKDTNELAGLVQKIDQ